MSEHVGAALQRAAALYPDQEATVDGERRWSYAELERNVAGFDGGLDRLGLKAGDVVAVLALNSVEHFVCWLGVPRSGRVLNDLNFRLAPAELEFILGDSEAKVLIVDDMFLEAGQTLAQSCPTVEHVVFAGEGEAPEGMTSFAELMAGEPKAIEPPAPEDIAGYFYTGGTTGLPKGVMLTHRNLVANAKHAIIALAYTEGDSYLHAAPQFHIADGASVYALTFVGGRHVFMRAFTPDGWPALMAAEKISHALLVPTMINMIVNHPEIAGHDLSHLRRMLYGASPMPESLLLKAMETIPCGWTQAYGMTEAAPLVTALTVEDHEAGAADEPGARARLGSAGRPVVGVEAEVRGPSGEKLAPGEPGEVWVRGPNIMKGYWNRPDETAAALDAAGWYHSGDAAYVDDRGYVFIVDRVKDMIISGGENVYSTEVENALYKHAAVLECAVFGVPDEQWGEKVHAAVVLKPGASATPEELIEHCRQLIAGFKLPRGVDLHSDPLPKSGAGKLLKRELRKPYWEGQERQVG